MRWQLVELSAAAAGASGATLPVEAKAPVSRLFSNSAAMAAANIAGRGLGYAYIVMMARRLDARYLGAYALLLTASMLIELVSNLGLDKILVREISAGSASAALVSAFSLLMISGGVPLGAPMPCQMIAE